MTTTPSAFRKNCWVMQRYLREAPGQVCGLLGSQTPPPRGEGRRGYPGAGWAWGSWAGLEAARSVRVRAVTLAPPRFLVGVPPARVQVPRLSWVLGNAGFPPSGRDLPSLTLGSPRR